MPNILTILRIILSPILLFLRPVKLAFFIVYFFIGLTDVFDGYFARKLKLQTDFGAKLDSTADTIFMFVVIYSFIFNYNINLHKFILLWVLLIAFIKIISIIIGFIKYKSLIMLHTYLNKFTGIIIFLFPAFLSLFSPNITALIMCFVATISAIEELLINCFSKKLNLNIKALNK